MSSNRRDFLRKTSMLASAFAFGSLAACNNDTKSEEKKGDTATAVGPPVPTTKPIGDFGLQLYTLRDDLPKDPKGVLKQVAGFGYKQLEGFEGGMGLWWGMTAVEFKKYLDELGVTMISSHCNTKKDFEKKAAEAAFRGEPFNPAWSAAAARVYEGILMAKGVRSLESLADATKDTECVMS